MPLLDLLSQNLINHPMLFDDRQPLKLLRHNVQAVHGAAPSGDVLNFELAGLEGGFELVENLALALVEVVGRLDFGGGRGGVSAD